MAGRTAVLSVGWLLGMLGGAVCGQPAAAPDATQRQSATCITEFLLAGSKKESRLTIRMNNDGGWCAILLKFNFPTDQVTPEVQIAAPPAKGSATAALADRNEGVRLAYLPSPGFNGTDGFQVAFQSVPTKIAPISVSVTVESAASPP